MRRCRPVFGWGVGALVVAAGLCVGRPASADLSAPTAVSAPVDELPRLSLEPGDRVLVLAPHPDDEVLGCAGVIQDAVRQQLPVRVVFLTYGDSNEWALLLHRKRPTVTKTALMRMGEFRRSESAASAAMLGLSEADLTFLGYPDAGTLTIWYRHWGTQPPFKSPRTRADAVPYQDARRPGAPYKGEEVLRDVEEILREFRPTKVFVSHPADRNVDHRALYVFLQVALWNVRQDIRPRVFPYLVHAPQWPKPRGFQPTLALAPPKSLRRDVTWRRFPLSPDAVERKRLAITMHRTQMNYSAGYLQSFARTNELFGDFPFVTLRASDGIPGHSAPADMPADAPAEASSDGLPEELMAEERKAFVGLERWETRLVDGAVEVSLQTSVPLTEEVTASIFLFGYRADWEFAHMPKVHIQCSRIRNVVWDQHQLPEHDVTIKRQPRQLVVRVPLNMLGEPDRILASAHTSLRGVTFDRLPWRVLELRGGESAR